MARKKKPSGENPTEDIASELAASGESLSELLPDILGLNLKAKNRARYAREKARAQSLGFSSPYQRKKYARQAKAAAAEGRAPQPVAEFTKLGTLSKFGVSESRLNEMRKANRAHQPEGGAKAHTIQHYKLGIDRQTKNFSDARVGYIVSYYYAVTNPNTNFYSITPRRRHMYQGTERLRKWRARQSLYLVRYAGIHDVDVFDSRYGDGSYVGSIGKGEKK